MDAHFPSTCSTPGLSHIANSFVARQDALEQERQERLRLLREKHSPSFAPMLVASPRGSPREEEGSPFDRLTREAAKKEARRLERAAAARAALDRELPFKPTPVARLSAVLAPGRPTVNSLYACPRRQAALAKAAAKAAEREPTHSPELSASSRTYLTCFKAGEAPEALYPAHSSPEQLSQTLQAVQAARANNAARLAAEAAAVQYKECTFAPQTNVGKGRPKSSPELGASVAGAAAATRRMRAAWEVATAEKAEMATALASLEVAPVPRHVSERWAPFSIASEERVREREARRKAFDAQMSDIVQSECPFRPMNCAEIRAQEAERRRKSTGSNLTTPAPSRPRTPAGRYPRQAQFGTPPAGVTPQPSLTFGVALRAKLQVRGGLAPLGHLEGMYT